MASYSLRGNSKKVKTTKLRAGSLINFIIGLVLLIGSAYVANKHQLTGWQYRVFYDLNHANLGASFTTAGKWITEGLGAGYPIAICVIVPLLFKKFRLAWRIFFTAGGAFVVSYFVKKIVNEPRPITILHGHHLHQRVVETGAGFPSGHETAATALALTIWFILPKSLRWLSIVWILAVAWSRLYLGVHTPVDIIGGFAVGLMAVSFVRLLPLSISKPLRLDIDDAHPMD